MDTIRKLLIPRDVDPNDWVEPDIGDTDNSAFVELANKLTHVTRRPSIGRSLNKLATRENCMALAQMLWDRALEGDIKAIDIVLDRLEGKVPLTLQHDTEITVVHYIPEPEGG